MMIVHIQQLVVELQGKPETRCSNCCTNNGLARGQQLGHAQPLWTQPGCSNAANILQTLQHP
jgi:hypothetical protein